MTIEQRLDSIERLLGAVAASLQTVAVNQVVFQQNIEKLEAVTAASLQTVAANQVVFQQNIENLEAVTERNAAAIEKTNKSLEDSISDLASTIVHFVEEGERERQALIETANADRQDMRRIWEYLFGQQRNGNGTESSTT